jgi:hypothetical protein
MDIGCSLKVLQHLMVGRSSLLCPADLDVWKESPIKYVLSCDSIRTNLMTFYTLFLIISRVEVASFVISVPMMIGDLAIAQRPK